MISVSDRGAIGRPSPWTAAALLAVAPFVFVLCLTIWRTPFPVSEAVALFEDVANRAPASFLIPDTSYYRPLYHLSLSAIWHNAGPLDARLDGVKLLHLVPIVLLVALFLVHLRPRSALEAAAAAVAAAVLIGSPGFRDNIEIPLSYTAVGMPMALAAWMLVNREPRWWQTPAVIVVALIAIGFKEQGLVVIPLVVAAWLTRAPGASRTLAAALVMLAIAYVAWRLNWRGKWPMFEQAVGFGFRELEPDQAVERFGAFPYGIYAYSGLATILNVLFTEPTRGVFSTVWTISQGNAEAWQLFQLGSSAAVTGLIVWWSIGTVRRAVRDGWSFESRALVALIVVLGSCGVLSFNYSRDRLGGMAVPFYALAAYLAMRAAALRAIDRPRPWRIAACVLLAVVATTWQMRAVGTIEGAHIRAWRNEMEWLTVLPRRREDFAGRTTYLDIMQSMIEQGTTAPSAEPTRYPAAIAGSLAIPPAAQ